MKRIQGGLGFNSQLPTNSVYRGEVDDLYNNEDIGEEIMSIKEKKISDEDRKTALAQYLGLSDEEKEEIEVDKWGDFEINGNEYKVLTEEESYDEFKDWEMSLIDDLGLDTFSENFQEHILENCIDESWFETVAEEEADFYIGEMSDDDLLEFAHDHDIAEDVEDTESEDFDRTDIEEDCKEAYEEEILNEGMSEYFEGIYGRNWTKEMKDTLKDQIDWDKVIEAMYDWDSRDDLWGSMASYDGETHEEKVNGEWFYIYWIN